MTEVPPSVAIPGQIKEEDFFRGAYSRLTDPQTWMLSASNAPLMAGVATAAVVYWRTGSLAAASLLGLGVVLASHYLM